MLDQRSGLVKIAFLACSLGKPAAPPVELTAALSTRLREAEQALIRLELAGEMVPSLDRFIYAFVRKEAVVSSQIEGTQATLVDLLTFEARGDATDEEESATAPTADVEEICNFLDALAYAREQLADPRGPSLSMRLLNETHRRLMRGVRGAEKQRDRSFAYRGYLDRLKVGTELAR